MTVLQVIRYEFLACDWRDFTSVSYLALLTVSLPHSYRAPAQQVAGSVVGRGTGGGTILPMDSRFSRTTGSVARGDIAGVGLLTVGGFTSGPIYFRASRLAWGLFTLSV